MNVLSLFDGMSCGRIALERAGVKVSSYYASEIDKDPIKISNRNYSDIIQLGNIENWKSWIIDWNKIDLLIGGSPCQGFSFAGKQLNFLDQRSRLFFIYVDILNHIKKQNPNVKFLLENVVMRKQYSDIITEYIGTQSILINSNLVSAQNRKRLYWTNIVGVTIPENTNTLLSDILETKYSYEVRNKKNKLKKDFNKSGCLTGTAHAAGNHSEMDVVCKVGEIVPLTSTGRIDIHSNKFVRRYTILECERLQTMPEEYTAGVCNSSRYKALINGWTVDVIAHIFKNLKQHGKENN
ncbi:MAG: DNA cytosine methyltransferase [Bacteroidota bacterium]